MRVRRFPILLALAATVFAVSVVRSFDQAPPPAPAKQTQAGPTATTAAPRVSAPAAPSTRGTARPPSHTAFSAATKRLFDETCSECHNSFDLEGGLDLSLYNSVETLTTERDRWEVILSKLKTREMP